MSDNMGDFTVTMFAGRIELGHDECAETVSSYSVGGAVNLDDLISDAEGHECETEDIDDEDGE